MLWVVVGGSGSLSKFLGVLEASGSSRASLDLFGSVQDWRALAELAGRGRVDAVGGRGIGGLVLTGSWGRSSRRSTGDVSACATKASGVMLIEGRLGGAVSGAEAWLSSMLPQVIRVRGA